MSATGAMYTSMGIGAASSLATAYAQSNAIKAAGKYKAALAETNSALAEETAKEITEAGDINASRKNLETQAKVGSELAAQGASGVAIGSGSSAIVRSGTTAVGAIDELTIRNNAARAAFGYKIKSIEEDGRFAGLESKSEAEQSLLSGGLQAVSGAASTYSNYLRWSKFMGGGSDGKVPDSYIPGEATA